MLYLVVAAATLKSLAGLLAGLKIEGALLEANPEGVYALWPWVVSAAVAIWALRCINGTATGQLLAGMWALVAAGYADRTLRDAGWWSPDVEWLLVLWIPAMIVAGVPRVLVASRGSAGARWWVALAVAPLMLCSAVTGTGLAGVAIYGSVLSGASSSARIMRS